MQPVQSQSVLVKSQKFSSWNPHGFISFQFFLAVALRHHLTRNLHRSGREKNLEQSSATFNLLDEAWGWQGSI